MVGTNFSLRRKSSSKNKDKKGVKSKGEKKKEKEEKSCGPAKPAAKPRQVPSDPPGNDDSEDNLDDNQNLIQLTTHASTPVANSVKRKKKSKDAASTASGLTQSGVAKDNTVRRKKEKKKEKPLPDYLVNLAKSYESKTVEEMRTEFLVDHKPNSEDLNKDTRYTLTFNVPPDSDYYDASKVEIPGVDCKFIAAAAPTTETPSMETFWRLVYDANVANIFYIEPAGKDFSQLAHFIPTEPLTTKDFGKMTVNNKKVERNRKEFQAVVEVLPEGCSNSIIVRFVQGRQWPDYVARKYRRIALHLARTLKNEKSTTLVVCKDGKGHSGQFILLHSLITDRENVPADFKLNITASLSSLRTSRWGAIQTEQQYLLIYMLILDYLTCKSKTFEPQARNLERAMEAYLKKKEAENPVTTPKEAKRTAEAVQFGTNQGEKGTQPPLPQSLYL